MRKGNWIQTYTGKRFWPLDPRPEDIDPIDIAQALSQQCRFSGHTDRHYSVLEHSIRVARLVAKDLKAEALLHDASEAYLVDIPRPMKRLPEFEAYCDIETKVSNAICKRFSITEDLYPETTLADKAMLWWEYQALFNHHLPEWEKWAKHGNKLPAGEFESYDDLGLMTPHALRTLWHMELLEAIGSAAYQGLHLQTSEESIHA